MTYEYICTACNHSWELDQSITAQPAKICPKCHAEAAKRQVSGGAGFILKGGGWYADGYGSSSAKGSGSSSGTSSESAGSSSSAKESSKNEGGKAASNGSEVKSGAASDVKPNTTQTGAAAGT